VTEPEWASQLRALEARLGTSTAASVLESMVRNRAGSATPAKLQQLDPDLRALYLAQNVTQDLRYDQFAGVFEESMGACTADIVAAYARVGASRLARLFAHAITVLSPDGPVPVDKKARKALITRARAGLEALDREFEALPQADLPDLLAYALANAARIPFTTKDYTKAHAECAAILPELRTGKPRASTRRVSGKPLAKALRGGCQCGAIRYELTQAPLKLYACHCVECRKQSGSAYGVEMEVAHDAVRLVQGTPVQWRTRPFIGAEDDCTFCPACGTRLWDRSTLTPNRLSLKAGSLDQPVDLTKAIHRWTKFKLPGVEVPKSAVQFEEAGEA
jgi:hypothetical protein